MPWMGKSSSWKGLACIAILLALLLAPGCSQSPTSPAEEDSSTASSPDNVQKLPFHDGGSVLASGPEGTAQPQANEPNRGVPFAASGGNVLPVGTLLTVRLKETVSGAVPPDAKSASPAAFAASLEYSLVINGKTVLARGTTVRGQLLSARAEVTKGNRSYLRLTLDSLQMNGREILLQTSSLFARGEMQGPRVANNVGSSSSPALAGSSNVVRIEKGRFLTFRLRSPVFLPSADAGQLSKNSPPGRR